MAYYGGAITIQPKAARLNHDTAIFKMDPYCVVWLGKQNARTSPNHDGGRNPHWNDVLTLFRNQEDSLRFLIYDRESLATDAFVAEGHYYFNAYQCGIFEEWIPLHYGERSAGELHVNIRIQPGAAPGYPQGYPQQSNISTRPDEYRRPLREVFVDGGRRLGEKVKGLFSTQPDQQLPVQPYPGH